MSFGEAKGDLVDSEDSEVRLSLLVCVVAAIVATFTAVGFSAVVVGRFLIDSGILFI